MTQTEPQWPNTYVRLYTDTDGYRFTLVCFVGQTKVYQQVKGSKLHLPSIGAAVQNFINDINQLYSV